jgi:hypothetical protein
MSHTNRSGNVVKTIHVFDKMGTLPCIKNDTLLEEDKTLSKDQKLKKKNLLMRQKIAGILKTTIL